MFSNGDCGEKKWSKIVDHNDFRGWEKRGTFCHITFPEKILCNLSGGPVIDISRHSAVQRDKRDCPSLIILARRQSGCRNTRWSKELSGLEHVHPLQSNSFNMLHLRARADLSHFWQSEKLYYADNVIGWWRTEKPRYVFLSVCMKRRFIIVTAMIQWRIRVLEKK